MLNLIRDTLLQEAIQSPNLLSDLAGLEQYIAESYHNRSFIELLQNADDAQASKFAIMRRDNFLFIANNGRDFNQSDLESLCRSASSFKIRGTTIGYRGIGFKSVVGIAQRIYLVSGEMELSFSRDKTKQEIPVATKVPLIRIPHALSEQERENISVGVNELKHKGYSTIFIFCDLIANEIEQEFSSLEYKSLLFLKNVSKVEILTDTTIETSLDKQIVKNNQFVISLKTNNIISKWLLFTNNNIAIAHQEIDENNNNIPYEEALVYAFLPTEDVTGLGVLINGDFSTDPSRRHVIFDENTHTVIDKVSRLILKIIEDGINDPDAETSGIIKALIPNNDPRISMMKKHSFSNALLTSLKNISCKIDFFKNLSLSPGWLNSSDFIIFAKAKELNAIENVYYKLSGFINFLKYLGAKESSFEDIKTFISGNVFISNKGCGEILAYLISKSQFDKAYLHTISKDWKIFISNGRQWSFNQVAENRMQLDDTFLNYFYEKGFTVSDLNKFFSFFFAEDILKAIFGDEKNNLNNSIVLNTKNEINDLLKSSFNQQNSNDRNELNIKKWRSAEQQVLDIFQQKGYKVEDVSRQNLGYDLIGISPEGKSILIEVKSIDAPGQKFKLTNNEVALAQEKKDSFILALLRQTPAYIELSLIQNPIDNLVFNRQCVQWIWECIDYEYKPMRFEI